MCVNVRRHLIVSSDVSNYLRRSVGDEVIRSGFVSSNLITVRVVAHTADGLARVLPRSTRLVI